MCGVGDKRCGVMLISSIIHVVVNSRHKFRLDPRKWEKAKLSTTTYLRPFCVQINSSFNPTTRRVRVGEEGWEFDLSTRSGENSSGMQLLTSESENGVAWVFIANQPRSDSALHCESIVGRSNLTPILRHLTGYLRLSSII